MKNEISEAKYVTGVYRIVNKLNNKMYIGSSRNIGSRWYSHINMLNGNKHHSKGLQNDWNEINNCDMFEFKIVQECEEKDLLKIEQHYIDEYDSFNNGYNSTKSYTGKSESGIEGKIQIPLKFDVRKDSVIFKTILDCHSRTDFIKNAIFYYISAISRGEVTDRLYPYNNVRHNENKIIKKLSRMGK